MRIASDLLGKPSAAEVLLVEGDNNGRVNQIGTAIFTLKFKAAEQVADQVDVRKMLVVRAKDGPRGRRSVSAGKHLASSCAVLIPFRQRRLVDFAQLSSF